MRQRDGHPSDAAADVEHAVRPAQAAVAHQQVDQLLADGAEVAGAHELQHPQRRQLRVRLAGQPQAEVDVRGGQIVEGVAGGAPQPFRSHARATLMCRMGVWDCTCFSPHCCTSRSSTTGCRTASRSSSPRATPRPGHRRGLLRRRLPRRAQGPDRLRPPLRAHDVPGLGEREEVRARQDRRSRTAATSTARPGSTTRTTTRRCPPSAWSSRCGWKRTACARST